MRQSRFTEEQIVSILHQSEKGIAVSELTRKLGISEATFIHNSEMHIFFIFIVILSLRISLGKSALCACQAAGGFVSRRNSKPRTITYAMSAKMKKTRRSQAALCKVPIIVR